jgi:hypothetical protein
MPHSMPCAEGFCRRALSRGPSRLVGALCFSLLTTTLACGPVAPDAEPSSLALQHQEIDSANGLTPNGLSYNGLSANGLSYNGLSANGLSANGLSANGFASWFSQNPAQSEMVMRYLVRCAAPAGTVRTYTDPQTQITYSWPGVLGLAPDWASGQPATVAEQQIVSACLAAHVNKFGVSVLISVLGQSANGQFIPFTDAEFHQYSRKEACFFGNLFNGEGVFFGADSPRLHDNESSPRACELSSVDAAERNDCAPLTYAGKCDKLCDRVRGETFYEECTWNGVTYHPITTRVSKESIYSCGDGVCQFTESCGRGGHANSCEKDCGRCPGDQG